MASSLPEELVQEILVRLPPDEPVHLAHASLVCKLWHRVLSNRDCFLRSYCGFHRAPPLLGYIQNSYYDDDAMQFVPGTSIKSPVHMPAVDYSRWLAIDCRHGRVLIHFEDTSKRRLVVWDPITGSMQHLSLPAASYPAYPCRTYTGAVLCAKYDCDHLDCQAGPFRVVFVQTNLHSPIFECATSYSSLTGAWSAPAPCQSNRDYSYCCLRGKCKHNLLIGDIIYFAFEDSTSILRYDLCTHWLSEINLPRAVYRPFLMKAEDGGLGLAALSKNRIHIWSRQDVNTNGIGEWVEQRVMELETLLPRYIPYTSYEVAGFVEGTNTIFINISTEIFTLDIKSKKVRKVGERKGDDRLFDPILPYVRFCTLQDLPKAGSVTAMKMCDDPYIYA